MEKSPVSQTSLSRKRVLPVWATYLMTGLALFILPFFVSDRAVDSAARSNLAPISVAGPDIRLTNVTIAQPISPFTVTTPVIGEQVFVKVDYQTENLPAGASYRLEAQLDGVPISLSNRTSGAGVAGVGNWTWVWGGWFATTGPHTVSITLDADNAVSEIDDTNNAGSASFTTDDTPDTLPARFIQSLGGVPGGDWVVMNYMDVNSESVTFNDFNNGPYAYDAHNGHDLTLPNFTRMDSGVPIYAAAAGTVTEATDGFFDRNTAAAGQPTNIVKVAHGSGWETHYYHLAIRTVAVRVGDTVSAGQLIGLAGSSGNSTDAHLHIGYYHNGALVETMYAPNTYFVNPLPYQNSASPTITDIGMTNVDPNPDVKEGPPRISTFSAGTPQSARVWFRWSHLPSGTQYNVKWYRPDASLATTFTFTASSILRSAFHSWNLSSATWTPTPGTWRVAVDIGGVEVASTNFTVTSGAGVPGIKVLEGSTYIVDNRTTSIDFGSVAQGSGAVSKVFTVQNHGTTTLNLSNLTVPAGFVLNGAFPSTVAAGGAATFTVNLTTADVGEKFGAIHFTTDDPDSSTFNFHVGGTVTGTAVAGAPVVTPSVKALAFVTACQASPIDSQIAVADSDSPNFNGGSLTVSFTTVSSGADRLGVKNTGAGPGEIGTSGSDVTFEGVVIGTFTGGISGSPLTVSLNTNATPAAVQALMRNVTFSTCDPNPLTLVRYVLFSVTDGSNTSNQGAGAVITDNLLAADINLSGNGLSIVRGDNTPDSADHTDFGSAAVSGGTVTRVFRIENSGTATLNVAGIGLSGTHHADFSVSGISFPIGIAPGGSTTFDITYDPSAPGARTATVEVASDDGDETTYDFAIQGSAPNTAPAITPATGIARQQGATASNSTIATVSDAETAAGSLTVTAITVPTGLSVTNIINTNGDITADIAADCSAVTGDNTIVLQVSDGSLTSVDNLIINVTPNAPPVLTYADRLMSIGGSATINPSTGPSDDLGVQSIALHSQGTFTGTISVDGASGVISISNAAPYGAHLITVRITDSCGAITDATFTLTVSDPFTLSVLKTGNGSGTVTSNPAGISCGANCAADFAGPVTLTPVADVLSIFTRWSGDCTGLICQPTVDAAKTVTARFGKVGAQSCTLENPNLWGLRFTLGPNVTPVQAATMCVNGGGTGRFKLSAVTGVALCETSTKPVNTEPAVTGCDTTCIDGSPCGGPGNRYSVYTNGSEIDLAGNSLPIADGDTTPELADHTDFDSVLPSGGSITRTFTIESAGRGDLTVSSITIGGTHQGDFTLGALTPASPIAEGSSATFTVTFDPSAVGLRTATVTIATDDLVQSTYDFAIQGTGTNTNPGITPNTGLIRQQGTPASNSTIATVSDNESAAGSLTVTATTMPAGITVTNIVNTNGAITADVAADCSAATGDNTVVLEVSDGSLTASANLIVNVAANTAPALTYNNESVAFGGSSTLNPATGPSDNGPIASIVVESTGTYTGAVSVDGAGVVSISNAAPFGSHTITIRATDNCSAFTDATFTLNVTDNVAPETAIDTNPTDPSNSADAAFTFSGTDNESGVASFECKLDTGAFAACSSPANYPSLTDGSHTFEVRAIDNAGNTDASPASYTWNIVTNTAPAITATVGLSRQQGALTSQTQIATVDDAESGANAVTVTVTSANPSNGVTLTNIVNTNGAVTAFIVAECSATNASFTLEASDGALTSTATLNVTITAAPTQTPTLGNYANTSVALGGTVVVAADAAPLNAATITASTSTSFKGTLLVNPATGAVRITNASPAGIYTVTVRALNGGCASPAVKTFTLTVTTPIVCIGAEMIDAPGSPIGVGAVAYSATVADFNGDGKQDLATANVGSSDVSVLLGDGAGGFTPAPSSPVPVGSNPTSVATADFNGDGKQDLVTANSGSGDATVLLGDGAGGFSATGSPLPAEGGTNGIAVGDFNGDSRPDIVIANYGSANLNIFLGDGSGSFNETAGSPFAALGGSANVVVGDFNNDSKQDLATANQNGTATILLGDGNGSFAPTAAAPMTMGDFTYSLTLGNFNGDGNQDLAVANFGSSIINILLGDGSGAFTQSSPANTGHRPTSVTVADFNSDGKQDLATANFGSGAMSVHTGNGSGQFTFTNSYSAGTQPGAIVTGDFNGDSRQDVAVANRGSSNVNVKLGSCPLNLSINDVTQVEGNSGASNFTFTVNLLNPTASDVVVNYSTQDGTATAASDYTATTGSVKIPANSTSTTINVSVNGDVPYEADETFFVELTSASPGVTIVRNFGTGTIQTDDTPPTFSINDVSMFEGHSGTTTFVFTVTKTGVTEADAFVIARTADSSASALSDYTGLGKGVALSFAPSETIKQVTVQVNGDTTIEPDETFFVNLLNPSSATTLDAQGVATIRDDDGTPAPTITTSGLSPISRQRGSAATNSTIATVNGGSLTVTATTLPAGISVTNIVNTGGIITANVAASCSATIGGNTIVLQASDGSRTATANLIIDVTANTPPILSYGNTSVISGGSTSISPVTGPSDNGSVPSIALQSPGTYAGTISVDGSTGVVSVSTAGPVGSHTITIRATDNCGVATDASFTLTVATEATLNVLKAGNGSGRVTSTPVGIDCGANCSGSFVTGSAVVLDAIPDPLSAITGWSGDGVGAFRRFDLILNVGKSVTARFAKVAALGCTYENPADWPLRFNQGRGIQPASCSQQCIAAGGTGKFKISANTGNCLCETPTKLVEREPSVAGCNTNCVGSSSPCGGGSSLYSVFTVDAEPTVVAETGITRQQGAAGANSQIATVSDAESGAGGVTVSVTSANPSNGVTLSNIVNTNGVVTADIVASCAATNASFTIEASDGTSTVSSTLNVAVTANPPATLTYATVQSATSGGAATISPVTGPSDNVSVASITVQSVGTYTGTISVNNSTGVVSVSNAAPVGSHTITVRATDNCGAVTDSQFTLKISELPSFSISDVTHSEGNSGTTSYTFIVTKSGSSTSDSSVKFQTSDGTATTAGGDYVANNGNLTFTSADTSKQIVVLVNGDATSEADEAFTIHLSNPANATISDADGTGTITNDDPSGGTISFSQASYQVTENARFITITVNRTGDASAAVMVDYATSDDSGANPLLPCATPGGVASSRCDFTTALGRLRFSPNETSRTFDVLINQDTYVEGPEMLPLTLSNPTGGAVLGTSSATLTITDDDLTPTTANAIDDVDNYVEQLYHDFLHRKSDPAGHAFWKNEISSCGTDIRCIDVKRTNLALAFYLSIEFQGTGFLIERMYIASYGDLPGTAGNGGVSHQIPVPAVRFLEFLADSQEIGKGVIVGEPGWETALDNNKRGFAEKFVQRSRFTSTFPTTLTPTQFVNRLFDNAGRPHSGTDYVAAINDFGGAANTADVIARGRALWRVAENASLIQQEFNRTFVLAEYYGFLRRNPDDRQDVDYSGYEFWLTKLNAFDGNFNRAEMAKAFVHSIEYRNRFGP